MKIQLVSDLHLDFHKDDGDRLLGQILEAACDLLVVAGDLAEVDSPAWAKAIDKICRNTSRVVYVPGNHEYYHSSPQAASIKFQQAMQKYGNLSILDRGFVEIEGLTIVGATLWFDHSPDVDLFRDCLNDFKTIEGFEPWVYEECKIAQMLLRSYPADIVVTHHLPCNRSVHESRKASRQNCFYVTPIMETMLVLPKLWLHGHNHHRCDYSIGDTRVICNPHGYPGERSTLEFDRSMIVDLTDPED